MFRKILPLLLLSIFFAIPQKAFAATVLISNVPANVSYDPFTVTVSVGGAAPNTTNYLRAAFYKNSTDYFGYTMDKNSSWYNGTSNPHQYFEIPIGADGTWSGTIQAKIDVNDSSFQGNGQYNFKVGRYTESTSSVTDWSDPSSLSIVDITPTPTTPENTPTPTKSPTPTKTPTPVPSSTPSKTPTPTVQKFPNQASANSLSTEKDDPTPTNDPNSSLGIGTDNKGIFSKESPTPSEEVAGDILGASTSNGIPWVFIGLGLIFLTVCGILAYFQFGNRIFPKFFKRN